MSLAITRLSGFRTIAAPLLSKCASAFQKSPLAATIQKIAYPIFKATTSSYLLGFGTFEFVPTYLENNVNADTQNITALKSSKIYMYNHGGLIAGSGFCGIIESFENFGLATFGEAGKALFKAGNLLFLGANIIALEENVRLYEAATKTDDSVLGKEWHKRSAISGIFSNLGYIIATSVLLLGGPAGIALAIGVIGASSGALKILCDFILWKKEYDSKCIETIHLPMQENKYLL